MRNWSRRSSISSTRACSRGRSVLLLALVLLCGFALGPGRPPDGPGARKASVLHLISQDPHGIRFVAAGADTLCTEPNLVIITHGWHEREAWPADMALAIHQRVGHRGWCCGWYDWRRQASRLLPSDAAIVARDDAGPSLGRQIVGLSRQWRHVHLIGHSAGSWLINEAANVVASETSAVVHLTFLDAYVPRGWDPKSLGRLIGDPCEACWAEHYFTRDPLNLTENVLTWACNVDVTAVNPGFKGHKFPWHWYRATIAGRYDPRGRFAREKVCCEAAGMPYGYMRSLEAGASNWSISTTLRAPREPVKVSAPR